MEVDLVKVEGGPLQVQVLMTIREATALVVDADVERIEVMIKQVERLLVTVPDMPL